MVIGPVLILIISRAAFKRVADYQGLSEAWPWLLLATVAIPIGMSIAVVGFLCLKGELDK